MADTQPSPRPPWLAAPDGAEAGPNGTVPQEFRTALSPELLEPRPATIGGFVLGGLLGQGGMGKVYEGFDRRLDRSVAIKVIHTHLSGDPLARQRFLREARSQSSFRHERVVPIWQVGEDDGVPFIVMPLLEGESLETRLARVGRVGAAEAVRIGREIAEGLYAAGSRGLVHRDIKPSNLWLHSPDDRVLILDFGLARDAAGGAITREGGILGTPQFMSPEQAQGLPTDARSDLFSLGVVLYRMVGGVLPFRAASFPALMREIVEREPAPILDSCPTLPPPLADLIHRLLRKSPADRPASGADVVGELDGLAATLTATVEDGAPTEVRRGPRVRPAWTLAGLSGLAALAGLLMFFNFPSKPEPARQPPSVRPPATTEHEKLLKDLDDIRNEPPILPPVDPQDK